MPDYPSPIFINFSSASHPCACSDRTIFLIKARGALNEEMGVMTNVKSILGLLVAVVAVVVGVGFEAAQASATKAPIVISYEKTCVGTTCAGTAGDDGSIAMEITSYEPTRTGAKLSLTEWITVGDHSFTAEMKGHMFKQEPG